MGRGQFGGVNMQQSREALMAEMKAIREAEE